MVVQRACLHFTARLTGFLKGASEVCLAGLYPKNEENRLSGLLNEMVMNLLPDVCDIDYGSLGLKIRSRWRDTLRVLSCKVVPQRKCSTILPSTSFYRKYRSSEGSLVVLHSK